MKKRAKMFGCVLILLLVVSLVSAADLNNIIHIESDDVYHNFMIRLKDADRGGAIFDTIYGETDSDGKAELEFEASSSRDELELLVLFVKDGDVLKEFEEGPFDNGDFIELDLRENKTDEVVVDEVNDTNVSENSSDELDVAIVVVNDSTAETTTEETEGTVEESSGITGSVVFDGFKSFDYMNVVYFVLAILVGGAAVFFFMRKKEPSYVSSDRGDVEIMPRTDKIKKDLVSAKTDVLNAKKELKGTIEKYKRLKMDLVEEQQKENSELSDLGLDL